MSVTTKPRLLVVSHVLPFPGTSGQQQRVRYTLEAVAHRFHVTFATFVTDDQRDAVRERLEPYCDSLVLLPSRYGASAVSRAWHRGVGAAYSIATGLKFSNYVIGRLELEPARLVRLLDGEHFDCALFEYWHASDAAEALRRRGVPCVLDMHNVLWKSFGMQVGSRPGPDRLKAKLIERYRRREEDAWRQFDAVVAINEEELRYVRETLPEGLHAFFAPMGIDLSNWPYSWEPGGSPRVAFYGALASPHNQRYARACATELMPRVWEQFPDAELWIVGSKPPESIRALTRDPRITVTGFVDDVRATLATMSAVVCPWVGRYGFRSRIVELLATGVPVVASPDAIAGMDFADGEELLLADTPEKMARSVITLLHDEALARNLSSRGRSKVESRYSNEDTYGRLVRELVEWLTARESRPRAASAGA
jgi:glycosyltransferase involved in cell wall biosynthesis